MSFLRKKVLFGSRTTSKYGETLRMSIMLKSSTFPRAFLKVYQNVFKLSTSVEELLPIQKSIVNPGLIYRSNKSKAKESNKNEKVSKNTSSSYLKVSIYVKEETNFYFRKSPFFV